ncbi:hypothetical protein BC827DRAFT_1145963 [Russula dissimulans]|nr:hypothetical protein BC827DRAFT_1145963 [Russula dissimulans]
MNWFYGCANTKSILDIGRLVKDIVSTEDFNLDDFKSFNGHWEIACLDEYASTDAPFSANDGWKEGTVTIHLPNVKSKHNSETVAPAFSVSGIYYRPFLEVIKSAFQRHDARKCHFVLFKLFRVTSQEHVCVYTDIYNSDAMLEEDTKIRGMPRDPGDDASIELAIASILLWSDSTHLASFGTASLWPIYMFLGNVSKYVRGKPSASMAQHLAYVPTLPDTIQNEYLRVYGITATATTLCYLKVELMQKIWLLLLDNNFMSVYVHGMLITCRDRVKCQIYPWIFTYTADYPEKVLLACIKYLTKCPCPHCLIEKVHIPSTGTKVDSQRRSYLHIDNNHLQNAISRAREWIFVKGLGITAKWIQDTLGLQSHMPNQSAFSTRLASHGFNVYSIFVVDLLHEFELGVWKAVFTHLLRVLYAEGQDRIQTLNTRQVIAI